METGGWHRRLEFPGDVVIVMHNANVVVQFPASATPDEWGNVQVMVSDDFQWDSTPSPQSHPLYACTVKVARTPLRASLYIILMICFVLNASSIQLVQLLGGWNFAFV